MRRLGIGIVLGLASAMLVLAAGQKEPQPAAPRQPQAVQAEGPWSLEKAAAPYRGQKINILVPTWVKSTQAAAKDFFDLTGIEVEVIQLPYSDHYEKTLLDARMGTGSYDINCMQYTWVVFHTAGLLADINQFLNDKNLVDPNYDGGDFVGLEHYAMHQGKQYALGFTATALSLYYRADLFEDPNNMRLFRSKYGYDLKPPQTWEQFLQIAQFFNDDVDWKSPNGERGHGLITWAKRGPDQWYQFLNRFAGMVYLEQGKKLDMIDDGYNVTFNNEFGVRALQNFKDGIKFAPAGALEVDYTVSRQLFQAGRAAMVEQWHSFLQPINDPTKSQVAGKVKVASLPGNRPCIGGWSLGILKSSKHKEAAFLFAQYLSNRENDMRSFVMDGKFPGRRANIDSAEMRKIYSGDLSPLSGGIANASTNPRIPETIQLAQLFDVECAYALTGQKDPKSAIQAITDQWNAVLKKYK